MEFLDLLVSNTHGQNKEVFSVLIEPVLIFSWYLGVIAALLILAYKVFKFIDDQTVKLGESICLILGTPLLLLLVFFLVSAALWVAVLSFAHTLYQIPLVWYAVLGITISVIYLARYLRRTHKTIYNHIKNPDAHTEKEDKESHPVEEYESFEVSALCNYNERPK